MCFLTRDHRGRLDLVIYDGDATLNENSTHRSLRNELHDPAAVPHERDCGMSRHRRSRQGVTAGGAPSAGLF